MGEELARQFTRNVRFLEGQLDGISHEQSLAQPGFGANCLNWTVGHMVEYRGGVASLLGVELAASDGLDRYQRESDPITGDGPGVVAFDELMGRLAATDEQLTPALRAVTDAQLAEELESGERRRTRLGRLLFLHFHDTLHAGQADVLAEFSRRA